MNALNGRLMAVPSPGAASRPRGRFGGRGGRWMYIFIGLLVVHAGSMITMAVIASSDSSFAVEPNYYEQALNWDAAAAQKEHNVTLGWKAGVTVSPLATSDEDTRSREVALRLIDAHGRALNGAVVNIECFHHARSAERLAAELTARGEGMYSARMPIERAGLWEMRVTVRRGPEVFTERLQVSVADGSDPGGGGGL